jgi:hypothetical protein
MTSEVQSTNEVAVPLATPIESKPCLCCQHFAVDFDSMPEAMKGKRPSRLPKRHLSATSSH